MKKKYYFTYDEWRFIVYALNNLQSSLIAEGRYTDTVDETLCKFMSAKTKRIKAA
ncbi:MAG: hypothetical protein LBD02_04020 [Christensenellaceae bacterium]|jgi:hypothetical protein|nr:hypothetical protein [Christensenellaceae bacterium]